MIKSAWVTDQTNGYVTLSIESKTVHPEFMRVHVREIVFPEKPKKKQRHTVILSSLGDDDLRKIRDACDKFLQR